MAQQQQNHRDEFGNDQRAYDVRHRDLDVVKNNDEADRWRNQFGSRTAIDPVANYAYGNGGYGAPPTGEPYAGPNYAASGFEYSTAYGTIGAAPVYGAPTEGHGTADRGRGDGERNKNMDMNRNRNMGRDQNKK